MAKKGNTYFTDKDFTDAEVLADPRFAFPCSFILRVGKSIVKETFYDVNGEKSVTTYQSSGDRILTIGDITATANKAYLALPPELKNEVIINGDSYSRTVPQQFPYTPVVADQKILIIEAQPDADVFHLVEGLEAPEAVEPAYTGLFIARLIVTTTGVLVETGNSTYKQKQESDWRYIDITDASAPITLALPFDTRGSFYLTKSPGVGIPTIAGIKKTSIAFAGDQYFYGGREGLIFNATGGDVILNAVGVVDNSVFLISNRITPFTLKNNTGVKWKLRGSEIELLPSGGGAELPPGTDGQIYEIDNSLPEKIKPSDRLTAVENEIDAEIVNRTLADNALQAQITAEKNRNDTQDGQITAINGRTSSVVDKMLHYWDATAGKWLSSGLKFVAGAINQLEFTGRIKADALVLPNNTNPTVPNRLRSDGSRLKYSNDLNIEKDIAYIDDLNDDSRKLLKRYVHSTNREIYPTNVDWATATITAPAHGFSHSGQKRIGLYINDLNKILGTYEATTLGLLSDYTVIPDEWVKTDCYVKVVDADTLVLCNSAGVAIAVNPTSSANNTKIDFTKWHIEDYSQCYFDDIPMGSKRVEIILKGMMSPYSTGSPNRQISPSIYNKEGGKNYGFRGRSGGKGTVLVIGAAPHYITLAQPVASGKQSVPFFTRITLDITDVVATREYVESVYNISGGIVTKLNDNTIISCVQNNGLAGLAIVNIYNAFDSVWFSNNTVIEIYKR
ncbi:MAG TPA: hypothetical protein P5084_00670 [Paludibacter sp.]|nr:hypothetical protein [Paludibacter sp.]